MSRVIRSRRSGRELPLYGRMLGLRHVAPSGFLCFVFLEGAVALGILLALAELVSWWGVLVLPLTVATMVKLNDAVAGLLTRPAGAPRLAGLGTVAPPPPMLRPAIIPRVAVPAEFTMTDEALERGRTVDLRDLAQPGGRGTVFGSRAHGGGNGHVSASASSPASSAASSVSSSGGRAVPVSGGRGGSVAGGWEGSVGGGGRGHFGAGGREVAEMDATALNGPPAVEPWAGDLDMREQRARQSAARRYE